MTGIGNVHRVTAYGSGAGRVAYRKPSINPSMNTASERSARRRTSFSSRNSSEVVPTVRLLEAGELDQDREGRVPVPLDDLEPAADEQIAAAILLDDAPDALAVGIQTSLVDDVAGVEDAVQTYLFASG